MVHDVDESIYTVTGLIIGRTWKFYFSVPFFLIIKSEVVMND